MPAKPKRKLPLYIPKIMADLIWATTKDSTSVHFGFGHSVTNTTGCLTYSTSAPAATSAVAVISPGTQI